MLDPHTDVPRRPPESGPRADPGAPAPGGALSGPGLTRRSFLAGAMTALPGAWAFALHGCSPESNVDDASREALFSISLAEWSLHRTLASGALDNLDFPRVTRERFGIEAVEYVNSFFKEKAQDRAYLADLRTRCEDHGVRSLLIMCDGEGALGDPDPSARARAVENHYRWVEAARFLGCHAIRVNAQSSGSPEEQHALAVDGLGRLTEFAAPHGISVLVENHGGLSSNGAWLAGVIRAVDHPQCGTLPDFGNFQVSETERYDPYRGVEELMPFARAVSAKSHAFDADGTERDKDFFRLMRIVLESGYRGFVGIEYEGTELGEEEGILRTKALLETVRGTLSGAFA